MKGLLHGCEKGFLVWIISIVRERAAWRIERKRDSHSQEGVFAAMARGLALLPPQIARQKRAVCAKRIGERQKQWSKRVA